MHLVHPETIPASTTLCYEICERRPVVLVSEHNVTSDVDNDDISRLVDVFYNNWHWIAGIVDGKGWNQALLSMSMISTNSTVGWIVSLMNS